MNQPLGRDPALSSEQLMVIRELVGEVIAREDLPALEAAYRDFRAGMDELQSSFEHLTRPSDQAGAAHPAVEP
ncbi:MULTISPECIES: hypothetical protein [unclassified Arthrobacter]|uniref:hypothetical protein n=1 Tax=unclassified Pseudarthrobacter TaxID=2647000 RepID=UPI0033910201